MDDWLRQKGYERSRSDTKEISAACLKRKKAAVGMPLKDLARHQGSSVPVVGYAVEKGEANYTRQ